MLSALKNNDFCTYFDHIVSKSGSMFSRTLNTGSCFKLLLRVPKRLKWWQKRCSRPKKLCGYQIIRKSSTHRLFFYQSTKWCSSHNVQRQSKEKMNHQPNHRGNGLAWRFLRSFSEGRNRFCGWLKSLMRCSCSVFYLPSEVDIDPYLNDLGVKVGRVTQSPTV